MIKSIIILTIIITLFSLLLPWWIIVVVSAFYVAVSGPDSLWKSIVISFLSGGIAYLIYSTYASVDLQRSPAELIANLFGELPSWSAYVVTGLIGGLAAAFGGMSGYLGEKLWN